MKRNPDYHFLQSCNMPQVGDYRLRKISLESFIKHVQHADENDKLFSHIGYESNIKLIKEHAGVDVPLHKAGDKFQPLESGDTIVIMKLKYMYPVPRNPKIEDFEFFVCTFNDDNVKFK